MLALRCASDGSIVRRSAALLRFQPVQGALPRWLSLGYLALCTEPDCDAERAMARRGRGEVVVVPIILQPCSWDAAPFGTLKPLPPPETLTSALRPVTMWPNVDEALRRVEMEIRVLVDKLRAF
jgi:hypothetical protein